MLFPNAQIIAFEPDPNNFLILSHNLNEDRIKLIPNAVSNFSGKALFYTNDIENNNYPLASLKKNDFVNKEILVDVDDIKSICQKFEQIDCCKIDVEGEESNIVDRIFRSNQARKFNTFIIEYHLWVEQELSLNQMIKEFQKKGFSYQVVQREKNYGRWNGYDNVILKFKRNEMT